MTTSDLKVQTVSIDSLEPDPANARKHSRKNLDAIVGSLRAFGQRRPLVVHGQVVIAGNGTLAAARELGWTHVAVTRTPSDWTYEQARAYALADNRTAELAEWDSEILAEQLVELDAVGLDVAEFGFQSLHPPTSDAADAFGALSDAERPDATQMTFTLTLRQAEIVKSAVAAAKSSGRMVETDNENGNGNALTLICQEWMS